MSSSTTTSASTSASTAFSVPKITSAFDVEITLPGSKSIALRQLAIAALCKGTTQIRGIPQCDDSAAMLDCIEALGASVTRFTDYIEVVGPIDFSSRVVKLDARMSGASTRLLLGLAALRQGKTIIDGHASLRARTNKPLLALLAEHGCAVNSDDGHLPVTMTGVIRPGHTLQIDGSLSSQYITALLIAAPGYVTDTPQIIEITGELVSRPYIDITLNEMRKRGVTVNWLDNRRLQIEPGQYQPGSVQIEGDASAATYFAALATLHNSSVTLTNLGDDSHQGDYAFLSVMEQLGATVTRGGQTHVMGPATMTSLPSIDMQAMPDAALTLIAMAPLLPSAIHITGLSSLHHKECDRLECPAKELTAMGVRLSTTEDSISVDPIVVADLHTHTLTTYHDHRMAMAFSLLASVSGRLCIDDKAVVNKTYPTYWQDYAKLCDD